MLLFYSCNHVNKNDSTATVASKSSLSVEDRKQKALQMVQEYENRQDFIPYECTIEPDMSYNTLFMYDEREGKFSLIDVLTEKSILDKITPSSESRAYYEPSGNYIYRAYYKDPYLYITSGYYGEGGYIGDYNNYNDGYYTSINKISNNSMDFIQGVNGYIDYVNNELIINRAVSIHGLPFYVPYSFTQNKPNQISKNGTVTDFFDHEYGKVNLDNEEERKKLYNEGLINYTQSVESLQDHIKYEADTYAKNNIKRDFVFTDLRELKEEGKTNALRFNEKYRGKTFYLNEVVVDLDEPMLNNYKYRIKYINSRSLLMDSYHEVYTNDPNIMNIQKGEKVMVVAVLTDFSSNTYRLQFEDGRIIKDKNSLHTTGLTDREINENPDYKKQYEHLYKEAFMKYQQEVKSKFQYNLSPTPNYDIYFIDDYSDNQWKAEQSNGTNTPTYPVSKSTGNGTDKLLTETDLQGLSKAELRVMRNEIFARHGLIFKSADLREYFSQQPWYKPEYTDVNHLLTPVDKKNIELIKKYE